MRYRYSSCLKTGCAVMAISCISAVGMAQTNDAAEPAEDDSKVIIVTANSRISPDIASTPGSVTVLTAEQIDAQTKFGNDIGEILQRTIPGFGVSSSGSYSNFSQTLRGRKPAVFIDGVPTTTPLRDGGRDLRLISPQAVGQIEVIRGATAIYGLGGAGGLINFATKEPGLDGFKGATDVAVGVSLANPSGSLNYSIDQMFEGGSEALGFLVSGYYENFDNLYDAAGNQIPSNPQGEGGIAESEAFNIFGKVVARFADTQSLALSGNFYRFEQNATFTAIPGSGDFGNNAPSVQNVPPPGDNQFTENWLITGRYQHEDLLSSKFTLLGYYGEYSARFGFFAPPVFPPNGGQSRIEAERYGLRADFLTPLNLIGQGGDLLWGLDYARDNTSQPVRFIEGPNPLLPPLTGPEGLLAPLMEQESIAPFVQFNSKLSDILTVRGGVRWESASVTVDTFTTVPLFAPSLIGNVTVAGGQLDYEEFLFNLGAVISPFSGDLDGVSFYAGFSQGFSVGDFGRALRATTVASIEEFNFEPQIIDSYEIGVRADYDTVKASLAGHYSESEFGSSFNSATLELVRAPEEVWGLEATIDVYPAQGWNFGATYSWVDGRVLSNPVVGFQPLDTSRINPPKATLYGIYAPNEDFAVRLFYTHSGRQNRFAGNPQVFGRADVEAFSLVDLSVTGRVGPGNMTLAINNLLNEKYFTPDAFRFANDNLFTTGVGTTARLSYSFDY